jgi:hypothetical protein
VLLLQLLSRAFVSVTSHVYQREENAHLLGCNRKKKKKLLSISTLLNQVAVRFFPFVVVLGTAPLSIFLSSSCNIFTWLWDIETLGNLTGDLQQEKQREATN